MIAHHQELRHAVVYGRAGDALAERVHIPDPPDIQTQEPTESRLRNIMSNDLICAYEDLEISALTRLVVDHRVGCIPIVDRQGRPVGMVTKTDLVDHLDALLRGAASRAMYARDIMMPVALVLSECATPQEAATLMILEDTHHVLVSSEAGQLVGVVSTKDLVYWLVETRRTHGLESSG